MRLGSELVEAALERWEKEGLLPPETVAVLRADADAHARRSSGRAAQYALAGTGAAVLLVAAGVLADWLWPLLEAASRTLVLGLVGLFVHGLGIYMQVRDRWRAASYFLQAAGLLVLLGTYMYSEAAWADATPGGIAIGLLALATPIVTAPRVLARRDPFLPAIHLALLLGFFAVFLDRSTTLSADGIIWILDGMLVVLTAVLVLELRSSRDAGEAEWALNAFLMALYAGFFLILATGMGPLELDEDAVYGLDVWVLLVAGLSLWGIHRAPPALQRDWFEKQLGSSVLVAIPLLFFTSIELWEAPAGITALLVGGLGAAGLWYAVRIGGRTVLSASCLAVLAAAWFYGVDQGGALGVVLALGASAVFLFWVSTRVGWDGESRMAPGRGDADARADRVQVSERADPGPDHLL